VLWEIDFFSGGKLGLCCPGAQNGDHIGLFRGINVPLVIRKQGDNWAVVGPCLISGMKHTDPMLPNESLAGFTFV
jgi:hypothetical protein